MRFFQLGLVCAAAIAVSSCNYIPKVDKAVSQPSRHEAADRQVRVPNEYLVTLAPEIDAHIISERFGRFGIQDMHELEGETYLMVLSNDPGPGELLDLVDGDARFETVQPNLIYWANRPSKKAK